MIGRIFDYCILRCVIAFFGFIVPIMFAGLMISGRPGWWNWWNDGVNDVLRHFRDEGQISQELYASLGLFNLPIVLWLSISTFLLTWTLLHICRRGMGATVAVGIALALAFCLRLYFTIYDNDRATWVNGWGEWIVTQLPLYSDYSATYDLIGADNFAANSFLAVIILILFGLIAAIAETRRG